MGDRRHLSISHIIFDFCDGTSIRGIRRAVQAEHRLMRCFWTIFVALSLASVLYIGSICLKAYAQYQTVVIQHKRPFVGADFPSVTLCSDAFLGDTVDARRLIHHPVQYQEYVDKLFMNASRKQHYDLLTHLRLLRTTVMYNINNIGVWSNLTRSFLSIHSRRDSDQLNRNHTRIFCSIASHETFSDCYIKVFYDLRYRNCLSFVVPLKQSHVRTEEMRLVVSFLTDKNPPIFYADPYVGGNVLLGHYVHIFLHDMEALPKPSPTFSITLDTHQWAVIDFDSVHSMRLQTPRFKCASRPQRKLQHAGEHISMTEHICRSSDLRNQARSQCQCEPWWAPFDQWPLQDHNICGSLKRGPTIALKEMKCLSSIDQNPKPYTDHDPPSNCIEPCSQRHYDPHLHSNVLNMAIYEKMIREHQLMEHLRFMSEDCTAGKIWKFGRQHTKKCHEVHGAVNSFFSDDHDKDKFTNDTESSHNSTEPEETRLWRSAFPPIDEKEDSKSSEKRNEGLEKRFLYLVARPMDRNIEIDEEALVWTTGSTIAQLGGASSFLAGVSFVVLGELIELIFAVFKLRRHSNKNSTQPPVLVKNSVEEEQTQMTTNA